MTSLPPAEPPQRTLRAKIVEEYVTLAKLHEARGPVLEIMHGPRQNAICMTDFMAAHERHVLVRGEDSEREGVQFHKGDANDLTEHFDDACFSTVIWDRALEHDRFFWLTLGEIKRILAPGGLLIVCTRGFVRTSKFGTKVVGAKGKVVPLLTVTGALDAKSADYWRISPQALRKVVLDGFEVKETRMAFMVPHLFGVGMKPA